MRMIGNILIHNQALLASGNLHPEKTIVNDANLQFKGSPHQWEKCRTQAKPFNFLVLCNSRMT